MAVPSLVYTGTLMTENAFYPLFLARALRSCCDLERPTRGASARRARARRVFAFLTRAQAIALVPAIARARRCSRWLERRGAARPARRTLAVRRSSAAGVVLVVVAEVARGRSPLAVLGAYESARRAATTRRRRSPAGSLYHLAELDLYVGVVPFAALIALLGDGAPRSPRPCARSSPRSLRARVWLAARGRGVRVAARRRSGSRSGTSSTSRRCC